MCPWRPGTVRKVETQTVQEDSHPKHVEGLFSAQLLIESQISPSVLSNRRRLDCSAAEISGEKLNVLRNFSIQCNADSLQRGLSHHMPMILGGPDCAARQESSDYAPLQGARIHRSLISPHCSSSWCLSCGSGRSEHVCRTTALMQHFM